MKIIIYIGFLLIYFLFLFVSYYYLIQANKNTKENSFIHEAIMMIVTNFLLLSLVFVIGQFFNLKLLIFMISVFSIGLILYYALWALIGSPKIPFKSIGAWAGSNLALEQPTIIKIIQSISLIILIIYPILIGIVFFDNSRPVEELRLLAFRFTIILALMDFFLTIPYSFGLLTSGYIDEDTRARFLIGNLIKIIPLAIYLSLLFWLYNIDNTAQQLILIGDASIVYSTHILFSLIGFLFLFTLLPYSIGLNRAKRMTKDYLSSSIRILKKIKEVFELSSLDNVNNKILESKMILSGRYERLQEDNIGVRMGLEFENDKNLVSPDAIFLRKWYEEAKVFDKRFIFYNWLNETYMRLGEFEHEIEGQLNDDERSGILKKYTAFFKSKYEERIEDSTKETANHKLWIAILAVLTPILSAIISEAGKLIIDYFRELV